MRTPILCYHKVGEPRDRSLNVRVRDFRKQVAFLARRYRLIPLRELFDATGPRAVLTFDDVYSCCVEPLLQAAIDLDARGTLFPVTAYVGDASRWEDEKARSLADWTALASLRDAGYEIGNHTHSHADLCALVSGGQAFSNSINHKGGPEERTSEESIGKHVSVRLKCRTGTLMEEIAKAEREIEARLGVRTKTFAYPFGRYCDEAVRAVRARGYFAAVTVRYGIAAKQNDPHLLPRILISYSDGLPGLMYKLYLRPLICPSPYAR